jgi:hypothetical protein
VDTPGGTEILRACGMPTGTYYATLDSAAATGAWTLRLEVAQVNLDTCLQSGNVSNAPLAVSNTTTGLVDDYDFPLNAADSPCGPPPSQRSECGRPNGAPGGATLWTCGSDGGSRSPEAVFHFRAPANGSLTVDTQGSSYDTLIYIKDTCLTGCSVPGDCLACNDDHNFGAGDSWSRIYRLPVTAATIYYIFVDGFGGDSGVFTLNVAFAP